VHGRIRNKALHVPDQVIFRERATLPHHTRDRVVNPACRSLLLLFRGQPLTPLGAALDAGNNASLLLTKILNSKIFNS